LGILNNNFEPTWVQKSSRIKVYNALAVPTLVYGSKIWNLRTRDNKLLTSIEMKFFRTAALYTIFDVHKRNDEILE
jgi:hypothetical protein